MLKRALALALLGIVVAAGCGGKVSRAASGSYCGRGQAKLASCGFTHVAALIPALCHEPADDAAHCLFECQLALPCSAFVELYCHYDASPLEQCVGACGSPQFQCSSGAMVSASARCDGFQDCSDGSDEDGCPTFSCGDGSTVPLSDTCDGSMQCPDGSDEAGCPTSTDVTNASAKDCGTS